MEFRKLREDGIQPLWGGADSSDTGARRVGHSEGGQLRLEVTHTREANLSVKVIWSSKSQHPRTRHRGGRP